MGIYRYEVIDKNGITSSGRLEAVDELAAYSKLQELGLMVTEIKEVKPSPLDMLKIEQKVKIGDLSLFSRQLAAMLNAGIPLTQSLYTLSKQIANTTLKKIITDVAGNVESGMSFTEALSAYPKVFSKLYIGMIKSGEIAGNLEEILVMLSQQLQKEKSLQDNIRSAAFYPLMVAVFALVILIFMMFIVVPIFLNMFPAGVVLPLPTRMIIFLSQILRSKWYVFLGIIVVCFFSSKYYFSRPEGKFMLDRLKIKIPILGSLIHKSVLARFSRTLATLLAGGIPVLQSLETAGQATGNILIENAVNNAKEKIQEGKSIAQPLQESGFFPPMVIQMITVGENSGSLSTLLSKIAEFYEDEVATLTKGLTALIEPFLLIFIGVTVGGMVIALYLPIFSAVTQLGM